MRIGFGYDVHAYAADRRLILGGVEIDYDYGLLGHSDADVLTHAVMDALLGSLALGDIGTHFPDTDPQYKNSSSLILLSHVGKLIRTQGYKIENIDSEIVCQQPKLMPYIPEMRSNLASVLQICPEQISVKATTEERLGFTGRLEGIRAYAVCLVTKHMEGGVKHGSKA